MNTAALIGEIVSKDGDIERLRDRIAIKDAEIAKLTRERDDAFERGKGIGKLIGWQQAKDDTSAMLAANFPVTEV